MNFEYVTKSHPTIEDFIQWLDDDFDKERKHFEEEVKGLTDEELHHTQLFDDNNELHKSYKLIRGVAEKLKQFENEWENLKREENNKMQRKFERLRKNCVWRDFKYEDTKETNRDDTEEGKNSEEGRKVGTTIDTDNYGLDGMLDEMANWEIPPSHF